MKCCVVKDLLPLYAEQLTSGETAADIRSHLEQCGECAAFFAEMQEQSASAITAPDDIRPLKTVRQRSRIKLLVAVVIAAVISAMLPLLFIRYFLVGTQLRSDQITMEIETYWDDYDEMRPRRLKRYYSREEAEAGMKEPDAGTLYEQVSIKLKCDCLSVRTEAAGTTLTKEPDTSKMYLPYVSDFSLYSVLMPPLALDSHMLRHVSLWSRASHTGTAAEGSVIMIRCRDGNFAYKLTDLAALADASPDGKATVPVGQTVAGAESLAAIQE